QPLRLLRSRFLGGATAKIEIDVEVFPIAREHRRSEAPDPWLDEVIVEPVHGSQLRHVRARDLRHCSRRADLLFLVAGAYEVLHRAIVLGQLKLRDIDSLRRLAVELLKLRVAGWRAAETSVIELVFPPLELLDHILKRH